MIKISGLVKLTLTIRFLDNFLTRAKISAGGGSQYPTCHTICRFLICAICVSLRDRDSEVGKSMQKLSLIFLGSVILFVTTLAFMNGPSISASPLPSSMDMANELGETSYVGEAYGPVDTDTIVFVVDGDIYRMAPDGSARTRLTFGQTGIDPSLSPDGSKIAFASYRDGNWEIYVMNVNGSDQTRLTFRPEWGDGSPAWSPDGSKIAFASSDPVVPWEPASVFVMEADGSNITPLDAYGGRMSWSPDGTKIVTSIRGDLLSIVNADGSGSTSLGCVPGLPFACDAPDWSPDGAKIVFHQLTEELDGFYVLYTMAPDGSNPEQLTSQPSFNPTWSPDGSKIAFVSSISGNSEIYTMNSDGSNQLQVTNTPEDETSPNWGFAITDSCSIPFYWQRQGMPSGWWHTHPLRTAYGQCPQYCSTIGTCGCALTAAAMLFSAYGNSLNPAQLSDCMGNSACPFDWGTGCKGSDITYHGNIDSFSYTELSHQLNELNRLVILGMRKWNAGGGHYDTHWVLVTGGQGDSASGYTMQDPWLENGANLSLKLRLDWGWEFMWMRPYSGSCEQFTVVSSPLGLAASPVIQESSPSSSDPISVEPSSTVTGTIWLYHATSITMTVHITATSDAGTITEMQVWNADNPTPAWQSFSEFAWLSWTPGGETIFARFRDDQGNISGSVSDSPDPEYTPPINPWSIHFIPAILNQ